MKKREIEELLLQLVNVQSVVNSSGEVAIIDFIENYLRSWEYFQKNPDNIIRVPSVGDALNRPSLLVSVCGQESPDTVVLLGHTDTVEIDDYGPLQDLATRPEELLAALRKGQRDLYPEARKDAESEEYFWGRGTLDMKAGVANELILLKKLSEAQTSFRGRVVALFVCDEEGNSAGMIAAIEALQAWRNATDANIIGVINTDYHTAQYPGDEDYYLFKGTVGKIMPVFYIRTLETHAGDPFAGLDANLVLANLLDEINLNPKYSDSAPDEFSVPPISLKAEDLKEVYSVKTNHEAWTLISVPLFEETPATVMSKMLTAAEIAATKSSDKFTNYQRAYCQQAKIPNPHVLPKFEIITLATLLERASELLGEDKDKMIDRYLRPINHVDSRKQTLHLIRQLEALLPDRRPRIVVGYAPPFYPAISYLDSDSHFYTLVDKGIKSVLTADIAKDYLLDTGKKLKTKTYYPYISDLSYLALPYDERDLQLMADNMPTLGRSYHIPLSLMKDLNLPVLNLGAYGFDAHKWTERVERDYSFRILPRLLESIVMEILNNR